MTVNPHPFVMATAAEQRARELRAQADRHRLAQLARSGEERPRRTDRSALVTVVAVALLLVARAATL